MPSIPVLGQIAILPYNFAPTYWLRCEGQTLSIAENETLFAVLGARYGGDGQTTFQLPDLRIANSHQFRNLPMPSDTKALGYHIAVEGYYPSQGSLDIEPFVGEVIIMTTSFVPQGYAECSGQTLAINQNQALFSLLGTRFGGNGTTTFQLPDRRSTLPVPNETGVYYHKGFEGLPYVRYMMALQGVFPSRN